MKLQNLIHILIGIVCIGLLPRAQAVVPPPDGGYPNFTTAEGTNALKNLTTGSGNTALGWYSLFSDTIGSFNSGVGAGTLALNNGDENTATGTAALLLNTTGFQNTANGALALLHNSEGSDNTATGFQALLSNTTGGSNTANGVNALGNNTTGSANTAIGSSTLVFNTTGASNTAVGALALLNNVTGGGNTANGYLALQDNVIGNNNTAMGNGALANNTAGSNTAVGSFALQNNTTGAVNIALGPAAGNNVTTASNVICIGVDGQNVDNSCYIGNIFGATASGGIAVSVNSDGKLGTNVSSRRFKDHIKPMEKASEALLALRPVTFRYKKQFDAAGAPQFGLVAEDVEKVNPDLVVRDKDGKPYSVRYDQVNAMLLNEFLKEHKKVQQQEATIARLTSADAKQEAMIANQQKQIEALSAGLEKVTAQLEVSKTAPQIVLNNQ